jgi:uncharacterized protein
MEELDERAFGAPVPYYRKWMEAMSPDSPHWATRDFSSSVGDVRAPVQLTGGWYDVFLPWMVEDFSALRDEGRRRQLIVGLGTDTFPGLTGVSLREGIAWLRAHLLGDPRMLNPSPVRVYVTGEQRWREVSDWPPPGARETTHYLQPGGGLAEAPPAGAAEPSRYRYVPRDPRRRSAAPCCSSAARCATTGPWRRAPTCSRSRRPRWPRRWTRSGRCGPTSGSARVATTPTCSFACATSSRRHLAERLRCAHPPDRGRAAARCPRRGRGAIRALADCAPIRCRPPHPRAGLSGAHPRYARNPGSGEDPVRVTHLVAADQEVFHDAARPSSVTLSVVTAASP